MEDTRPKTADNQSYPSVSVVIAAYNAAAWICETLDSIIAQSYPVLEILVIDDGSSDDMAGLVQSYKNPVSYQFQAHQGQPAARNAGLHVAKGDVIAFIDADDYWQPQKLEEQLKLLHTRQFAWVICDAERFDNSKKRIDIWTPPIREGDVLAPLFLGNFIISPTPIVRREVFNEVGYFNETPEARIGEDWDMWLRIAARFPLGVVWKKLAYMRSHSASMIASTSINERVHGLEGVIERAVEREPQRLSNLLPQAFANIYYGAGVQFMKQDQYREGRGFFLKVLRHRPFHLVSWIYIILSLLGPRFSSPIIGLKRNLWSQSNDHGE